MFTGTGRYVAELGNSAVGECDTLDAQGHLQLAGTLELKTLASFTGAPGDSFMIARHALRSGTFATVTFNGAPAAGVAEVHYGANETWVVIAAPPVDVPPLVTPSLALRFAAMGSPGREVAFALDLPEAADVQVQLVDVTGRLVATLHRGPLAAGRHRLSPPAHLIAPGVLFGRAVIATPGERLVRTARAVRLR